MALLLFLICLLASTLGAVAGFGGGVIIKPVVDALGILPVSTISFMSGCTVLCMSVSSLIRSRNNGVRLRVEIATPLAIGAVLGGLAGQQLFRQVKAVVESEQLVGGVQSVCMTVINVAVLCYICFKSRLPSGHVKNLLAAVVIGLALGCLSSFLGIGGGPYNVAVLFLLFSMDAKEAAKNSIYIILFSQAASLITTLVTRSVPEFRWDQLVFMAAGGVAGAMLGAEMSKRMDSKMVEKLLISLLLVIICINIYNVIQFFD